LGRAVARWRALNADIGCLDTDIEVLLAGIEGQVLTSLPGVQASRAGAFAAFSMPIAGFPDAEHLYSATGLAPATYQSSTINRRGGISRQGLPEHRDALMSMAWGLSMHCAPFTERAEELRNRRDETDAGPGRPGPPRLPARPPDDDHPRHLQRAALPCRKAPDRAVTAS
jgi:transposase